jgi:hypothetical protein
LLSIADKRFRVLLKFDRAACADFPTRDIRFILHCESATFRLVQDLSEMPPFAPLCLLSCFLNSSNGAAEIVARDKGGIKRFDSDVRVGGHRERG